MRSHSNRSADALRSDNYSMYCPACDKTLEPDNLVRFLIGYDDTLLYLHDGTARNHSDFLLNEETLAAMRAGLQ